MKKLEKDRLGILVGNNLARREVKEVGQVLRKLRSDF